MKLRSILIPAALVLLAACHREAPQQALRDSYAYGADCSWLSEEEADSVLFYNANGEAEDCLTLLQQAGMNSLRLRVWVNHQTGWSNSEDVIRQAERAWKQGLRLMIDFHYSDFFADPHRQDIPAEWQHLDADGIEQAVREHTLAVLQALRERGIEPEWIQVGNETRYGMLWPLGHTHLEDGTVLPGGWANYGRFTRAGYEACHEVFDRAYVIVHIDNAYMDNVAFFDSLYANGGRWDMIGLSHYPMMGEWNGGLSWQEMNRRAEEQIKHLYDHFQCPILLSEIGTKAAEETEAVRCIADVRQRLDSLPYFRGIFYWEPQIYQQWRPKEYIPLGWGAYDMGAFTEEGRPNSALLELWKH